MWWISVAMFGQSGISQWMMSVGDLWRDFNQSVWYLSIFLIFFDKIKRIFNHIILKRLNQFFCVYMIRISQTSTQWLNKWSSIIFKWFTKFGSIKRNRFHQFRFFIFFHQEFVYCEIFTSFVIYNLINYFHLFWNQEINFRNDPQPIWNIYCTKHVVFLFSDCRTNIFFSWSFVIPSWLFNIFHIWNSMFWRVF